MPSRATRLLPVCLAAIASLIAPLVSAAAPPQYIWLEGEKPSSINIKPNVAGWGHPEWLSGRTWLQISVDADKLEATVPHDGILMRYDFSAPEAGDYQVWDRVGYEFVRSPFQWRVDSGAWTDARPETLTTDLMELATWTEVAWLKLGAARLTAGTHALEIRLPRTVDDKGKPARILYASDALCLTRGEFTPRGALKPDDAGVSPADEKAARNVFTLPDPASAAARTTVALKGDWEICRNDEQAPGETAAPIKEFPASPHWTAIAVPGDRNTLRPDLLLAHRLWYRTRVQVPESCAGRSFQLFFPQNNLNTTVWVNGVYCGFDKNPYAHVNIDITKAVHPGVNEVWVGIRDAWYGYSASPSDPMKLRRLFNLPLEWLHQGFQTLAYPIWNAPQSGILVTPQLIASGRVHAEDIFCKPSVARGEMAVEATLINSTAKPVSGELRCQVVETDTGSLAKELPPVRYTLPALGQQPVSASVPWKDPKLWWPDSPHLYALKTTVTIDDRPADIALTQFGFREWSTAGSQFTLNGIPFHGWNDQHGEPTLQKWLASQRSSNQTMFRLWGTSWYGMSPDESLDWLDAHGIVTRKQDMLDGQAIGYMAVETEPEMKKRYGSDIKMDLMQNWRDQVAAEVKGERNHPSVMIWSIENEWLFINCINLYGGLMDQFEAEVKKTSDAVRAVDSTRLTMSDGGGANKDNSMPVHGNHYAFGDRGMDLYPGLAYEANPTGGGRGRWVWDQKRPRFLGEDFYAAGYDPGDFSYFGGEQPFQGRAQARPAVGLIYRILTEGYRWAGYGAWDLYLGREDASGQYGSNAPRAVFCRQWDWSFGSGQRVGRTLGIFNDTHSAAPITFTWALTVAGGKCGGATLVRSVPPGASQKFDIALQMPRVTSRSEGSLTLTLAAEGRQVFTETKAVSVLPDDKSYPGEPKGSLLAVYDPDGSTAAWLRSKGLSFTPVASLSALPARARTLVIGRDALDAGSSGSTALAAFASSGRAVIVLEQKSPLRYQGLPAAMQTEENSGRVAFAENLEHPLLRGLRQKDFFTWGPDETVYRNAYQKPTQGAVSLVECGSRLHNSALAEVPAGRGVILVCQMAVGAKLGACAPARQLFQNLLQYASTYRQSFRPVTLVDQDAGPLPGALGATGIQFKHSPDVVSALIASPGGIVAAEASPKALHALAESASLLHAFNAGGGWLMLSGLTPEGLADYNRIVGFPHMIRPFRPERVSFPAQKSPLTAGLSNSDIVMQSGELLNNFSGDIKPSAEGFTYVVDYDEIAPFAKFPEASYFGNSDAGNDHNPLNMVNGFLTADGWQYIFSIWAGGGVRTDFDLSWPQAQTITQFTWAGNALYDPTTRVELTFDGGRAGKQVLETEPNNSVQVFEVRPPRTARTLNVRLAEWQKTASNPIIGVDNLWIKAQRSPQFYQQVRPLLNIGALMAYPRGRAGILLCNVKFLPAEAVPENGLKKQRILTALLRNIGARVTGGSSVIAGSALDYVPIDISKQANQYRDERGWFGDSHFTFRDMPTGRQVFGGAPFQIYSFATSPVPTVVMLGGPGVPNHLPEAVRGIPVNRKADALFFLQAARIDQRRDENERKAGKRLEMARYVITYADGTKAAAPIYSEISVDDYRQERPAPLAGAQIAWTRPYSGGSSAAVAYLMQWDNPRPDKTIASVDLEYGPDRRGVPALLAITAASAVHAR